MEGPPHPAARPGGQHRGHLRPLERPRARPTSPVNLYMAHGGTHFGFRAGANHCGSRPGDPGYQRTVTSYDYDAPIGEAGELTAKFRAFREVIGKYVPLPEGPLPEQPPRTARARAVPA
ncbi:beta-galactosidase [Streptomyces sp. NPDC006544]|uniref:beta-galactosidase n=1 Tax=Streptomyces sp. NPDC006544 TaxID=3154583 RepID=UPI0033A68142